MTNLYYVDFDEADDPEASHGYTWSAAQIAEHLPDLAPLLFRAGDGSESLTFTHELSRITIRPAFDD